MNPYNFSLLFFSFCAFFISLLIWLKRNDRIGWRYFIFSILVSSWGMAFSIMISGSVSKDQALFWGRAAEMAAVFIPATWIHFVGCYLDEEEKHREVFLALYGLASFCGFMNIFFSGLFITDVQPTVGFTYYFRPGIVFHVFTGMFVLAVPYGFVALFQKLKGAAGNERSNLIGFISVTMAAYFGASLTFLPLYEIMCPQYGLFILPVYPFGMAYFMIRRSLFEETDLIKAAHRDKLAAIGTIATSINHEIRNPLYIIHGMAESFLENFRGENQNLVAVKQESVAAFERTAQQAKRAMEIMGQLSLFAKQKIADTATDPELANLLVCLENVLPLIRHEMALEKIKFEKELPEKFPALKANPRQLEEILFNLIVNACQAMKPKGGTIRLSAKHSANKVIIQIEDNGPGIPQDRIKQIFEPFYTTKEEGTGLGLYITRQLVEKNGGKISVASAEGRGTLFCLEFEA